MERGRGRRGLAARLTQDTQTTLHAIPPRAQDEAPLSASQRRIWFFHEVDVSGAAMDVVLARILTGTLDRSALESAVAQIVSRHEPLRSVLVDSGSGEPVQRLLDADFEPVVLDLAAHLGREANDDEVGAAVAKLLPRGLRLGEPLFRWGLVKAGDNRHALVVSVHHIVFDGTSVRLFWDELESHYNAALRDEPFSMPDLPVGFLDFAAWSRTRDSPINENDFWVRKLEGATSPAELPGDRHRKADATHRGSRARSSVEPSLADGLRALARERRMTLFMVLEAAFSILVSRWTGSADVVVGTPVAGRVTPGSDQMIGCFINMIPLRTHIDPWSRVDDTLERVRDECLEAFAHQDTPFEDIVRDTDPPRLPNRHPLFDLVFVLNRTSAPMRLTGLDDTEFAIASSTTQVDLTFSVYEQGDGSGLDVVVEYDSDLFDVSSMTGFADQWRALLRQLVDSPGSRVRDLALMTPEEEQLLLRAGDASRDTSEFEPVAELLVRAVKQHAESTAVVLGENRLTYAELEDRVGLLCERLDSYAVSRGDVVAVALDRSIDLVVAQVAVLVHGAVLLPVDMEQPGRRIDDMLADAGARLVLAADAGAIGLTNLLPVLDVTTPPPSRTALGNPSLASRAAGRRPHDAVYTLFTSGSTGRPKGAVNTQAGIANRIRWMQETYQLDRTDRVLHKTPIAFDVAVWEWLWPLTVGATVVLADPGAHRDPVAVARCIVEHQVTFTHFIPSMLRLFAAQPEALECVSLRQIVCSGEELTAVGVAEALRLCPAVDNLYGPTEAAIDVTRWVCRSDEQRVPIGSAISGVRCRVVDDTGALVPVGVPGELLIGGVALAQGYAQRPGLTARAFVPDPWSEGQRLYRTGDRVRWREFGVLEFLGRLDAQVKVRGVRVEPGEIEVALGAHPDVVEAAVVLRTDVHRGAHLAAFVSGSATPSSLRSFLRGRLPEAMVPTIIESVDRMPRTASGKIDRSSLTARAPALVTPSDDSELPSTDTQQRIAQMWSTVLGIAPPGLDDNFFDLGGHSLIITKLSTLVREAFGVCVQVRRFLEVPTVRGMAEGVVEAQLRGSDPDAVAALLDLLEQSDGSSEVDLRSRLDPSPSPLPTADAPTPQPLASIGLPTFERVPALLRALDSYQANARRHGHSPSFTIMDNSTSRTTRDEYREALTAFARRSGAEVSYAGAEEKTSWLDECARESGVDRRVIAFGLFGHSRGPYNAANNANANILHATGRPLLCADDDTLADLRLPPTHSEQVRLDFGNPEINWSFDDLEQLDSTMVATDGDVLGTYGALLGRTPAEIVAASPAPRAGADDRGRVALVVPSLTGDCGWASPSSYLHLTGKSLERLTETDDAYLRARISRNNARFVEQPTVVRRLPGFMCTFYALDTSMLVLPYLPCTMGNDTLYPRLHGICFPEDAYAFSPLALRHEPVDARHFWPGEVLRGASGIDFSFLVAALVEPLWAAAIDPGASGRTRSERVTSLGGFLVGLGELPPVEFWALADDSVRRFAEEELGRQQSTLASHHTAAQTWRDDLRAYVALRERAMGEADFAVPLDLSMGEEVGAARDLSQELVLAFGELLVAWPDIVAAADALTRREHPLARAVRRGNW